MPREFLQHPAVATLPGVIFKVLVALNAEYHGKNNGALAMTREIASKYGLTSVGTVARALSGNKPHGELIARGLVVITDPGSYSPARIARYGLTLRSLDNTDFSRAERIASHTYRKWEPTAELLDKRAKRKQRAAAAAKVRKQKRLSDGRSRPGPMVGPEGVDEALENGVAAPMVGAKNAAPGSDGRTLLRSNHRVAANGGGTS